MSAFALMLGVAACYTVTSLSDKYAAARAKFPPDAFTFLMCASMSVFLALTLPFQTLHFELCPQTLLGILLTAACKLLEFSMSIKVLRQITAFELKAWLGVTVFASYFTDVLLGGHLQWTKLLCIAVTAAGLVLIVRSEKAEPVDYKQLALSLLLYLLSKFGSETISDAAYQVSPVLCDANATPETKALFAYICAGYGKQVLAGQVADKGLQSDEFKAIYDVTGKKPAILGLDMMDYTPGRNALGARESGAIDTAIEFRRANGIVTFCWHWNAPAK